MATPRNLLLLWTCTSPKIPRRTKKSRTAKYFQIPAANKTVLPVKAHKSRRPPQTSAESGGSFSIAYFG